VRLTLLGSGDSAGMPLYGCECERCSSARHNPDLRRGPASALLEVDNKRYLIDAGQMDIAERFHSSKLDGILLTHFHPDHVQGLFHLRWGKGKNIPVYCPTDSVGCADLFKNSGILDFQIQRKYEAFNLGEVKVTPLPLIHSKPTLGYLIEHKDQRIAYLVDTIGIPDRVRELLQDTDLEVMIIDTTSSPKVENRNHNNLTETLLIQKIIQPKKTVMTHISHDFDKWLSDNSNDLPDAVIPGYDGCIAFP